MQPSLVNILRRKSPVDDENLVLIVDVVQGHPQKGDVIFLRNRYAGYCIEINEIVRTPSWQHYELHLDNHGWAWTPTMMEDARGNTFLCALDPKHYLELTFEEKMEFISSLVGFLWDENWMAEFLRAAMQPTIKFVFAGNSKHFKHTKFGGLPLAPKDFKFPTDENGRPALFIGQLDLSELKQGFVTARQLKGNGMLYIFGTINVDHDHHHTFKKILVRYIDQFADLTSIALPADLAGFGAFPEIEFKVVEEVSLPDDASELWPREKTPQENDMYRDVTDLLLYNYGAKDAFDVPYLLGHPPYIHDGVLHELETRHIQTDNVEPDLYPRVAIDEEGGLKNLRESKWRHLLSFEAGVFRQSGDFVNEFNFFMIGSFTLLIQQDDLDNMDFNHTLSVCDYS